MQTRLPGMGECAEPLNNVCSGLRYDADVGYDKKDDNKNYRANCNNGTIANKNTSVLSDRFNDQFSVVAAVNDLGFIHWANNNISIKGGVDEIGQFYDNGDFLFNGLDWEQLQSISNDETYREHFLDTLKQYFQLEYAPLDGYNTMLNTNLLLRGNYDLDANNRFSAQVQGQFLGTGFRPALTLAYCGSFLDNFSVCATYTAMPNSYSNFGLGLGAMIKTCHIYLATNNIIGCFKPLNNSGFNVQAGIVFNLFEEGRRTLGD